MFVRPPSLARFRLHQALGGLLLLILVGCRGESTALRWEDLTATERLYVTRVVTLERAKTMAMMDPAVGATVLDSLAVAWGDSSRLATLAAAPTDPRRAALVGTLLSRILAAEQDSLQARPDQNRLQLALPAPEPTDEALPE